MPQPTTPNPLSLRVSQICALTGLSRDKVRDEIATGRLPARKVGRATVVLRDDLVAWLENLPLAKTEKAS